MKTNLKSGLLSCLCLTGGLVLGGCSTDDSIDVGDVDTTIGVNTDGITVPANSTKAFPLGDVLDIDDSDCIVTDDNGNYTFIKEGDDIEPTVTKVNPVEVNTGTGIAEFPLAFTWESLGLPPVESLIPNIPFPSRIARKAEENGEKTFTQRINTFNFTQENLSGDIVVLNKANTKPAPVQLEVIFSPDLSKALEAFSGLTLELPNFLRFQDNKIHWQNGPDREDDLKLKDVVINGDHVNRIELGEVLTTQPFVITGYVTGLDFDQPDTETQKLNYTRDEATGEGTIDMNGYVTITVNYGTGSLTPPADLLGDIHSIQDALDKIQNMRFAIDSKLRFGGNDGKIELESVEGQFKPHIDFKIDGVEITDIPDFLTDDDVSLKLHDVRLTLDIESTLPLTGVVKGTLRSYYSTDDGTVHEENVVVNDLRIEKNQTNHIVICRQGEPSASTYIADGTGKDSRTSGDIADMIRHIPDSISFECNATTLDGETTTLYLNQDFTIKPSYKFEAPLTLDQGSVIIYEDEEVDWNKDLNSDDVELGENSYIEITGVVENQTPLQLNVYNPVVLGLNGQELPGIKVKFLNEQGAEISPLVVNAGTTNLTIRLDLNDKDLLKKIDGLRYKVKAEVGPGRDGTQLNSKTQTVQIKDLRAKISGKFIVEL